MPEGSDNIEVRWGGIKQPVIAGTSPRDEVRTMLDDVLFFFDYADPLSFLLEETLRGMGEEGPTKAPLRHIPFELRPPPEPILAAEDAIWLERWDRAAGELTAMGIELTLPRLVPWTRKAHEFVLYAREAGQEASARRSVFSAFFREGSDIGRVDVLLALGRSLGLDPAGLKVSLDVDRHSAEVAAARERGRSLGVADPPALVRGGAVLRGFPNRSDLVTFLQR